MKKQLTIAFALLSIVSCNNNGNKADNEENDSIQNEEITEISDIPANLPEMTDERFQTLVAAIPNHTEVNDPESTLTDEYYDTWKEAWEIPSDGLGDMGSEECLFYFVCGNDPCDSHTGTIKSLKMENDTAMVHFVVNHKSGQNAPHTLKLVVKNDEWVIADFDNTLSMMKEYIKKQRVYFRSEKYRKDAEAILDDPKASDGWKEDVRNNMAEVEDYFEMHP